MTDLRQSATDAERLLRPASLSNLLPKPYFKVTVGAAVVKSVQAPESPTTPTPTSPSHTPFSLSTPSTVSLSPQTNGTRPTVPPKPEFLKSKHRQSQKPPEK